MREVFRSVMSDLSAYLSRPATGGSLRFHVRGRRRDKSYDRRGQLPNRIFIDERPSVVEMRQRIGDWESDTIIGRKT